MTSPDRHSPALSDSAALARALTRRASAQTYHTIRWLVDRGRVDDAYRAYAYFRWVDDTLDAPGRARPHNLAFLARQQDLLARLQAGEPLHDLTAEERMLADLLRGRGDDHPGLRSYLVHMMAVMAFDAERRGRLIGAEELEAYSAQLATAVMDALTYFIGHEQAYPDGPARTRAVQAAHITHMLRDTLDDLSAGYFNIPRQVLESGRMAAHDLAHPAYREWVRGRVERARRLFAEGRSYIRSMANPRIRLAGRLYCLRFEGVLRRIARQGYLLAPQPRRLARPAAPPQRGRSQARL